MPKTIAIIPARGGSKRIPKKNIRDFCGKPIICYPIETALTSGLFDVVMVSTDDEEIKLIAATAGAEAPFRRSSATADDFATTADVIKEVLAAYRGRGEAFERFFCIYPTTPLLSVARLKEAMILLEDCDGVMPVLPFSYPPQRGVMIEEGRLKSCYPEFEQVRSQDLPPLYHDAGQFYAYRTAAFLAADSFFLPKLRPLILAEMEAQDIDNEADWKLAELKHKLLLEMDKK